MIALHILWMPTLQADAEQLCNLLLCAILHLLPWFTAATYSSYSLHCYMNIKNWYHHKLAKARLHSSTDDKLYVIYSRCLSFSVLQCLTIKGGECWTSWKWANMTSAQDKRADRCRHADSWACKHQNRPT